MPVQLDFETYSEDLPAGSQFWQASMPVATGRCLRLGAHAGGVRPQVFDSSGVCAGCHTEDQGEEVAY